MRRPIMWSVVLAAVLSTAALTTHPGQEADEPASADSQEFTRTSPPCSKGLLLAWAQRAEPSERMIKEWLDHNPDVATNVDPTRRAAIAKRVLRYRVVAEQATGRSESGSVGPDCLIDVEQKGWNDDSEQ